MATRRPVVLVGGKRKLLPAGDTVAGGGAMDVVRQPLNVSPADNATNIGETPTLTGSAYGNLYGAAQVARCVQVSTAADFSTTVIDTGDIAGASTSYTAARAVLSVSTAYYWRMRYKDVTGVYSAWSVPTKFTTAAVFNDFIATPTATPASYGDAFEGGFYAGLIWNEIAQSANSKTIGTGTLTLAVADMAAAPIVYSDQQVEVRSRANPANNFQGTVTGAHNTTLTINVTAVSGSGTFTDWSVMSRYRLIAAPKSSGENAGIAIKNANTALPMACTTLNEGWRATEAMRLADTSTVYPAAYWARGLTIGGYTDWYIPARDELELMWRYLKPVTDNNYLTRAAASAFSYATNGAYNDTATTNGLNLNSAPPGAAYTASVPGQTSATAFKTGGTEAFTYGTSYYWSSTDYNATGAWYQFWHSSNPGYQGNNLKATAYRVRAVRRSII